MALDKGTKKLIFSIAIVIYSFKEAFIQQCSQYHWLRLSSRVLWDINAIDEISYNRGAQLRHTRRAERHDQ